MTTQAHALHTIERYEVVDGRKLAFVASRAEPLIEDAELAVMLEQPVKEIREAAVRLVSRGFFNKNELLRSCPPNLARPGRPAAAGYLFTEWQAYVLISQSRSPVAAPLTRAMAQIYEAWRRGRLAEVRAVETVRDARIDEIERTLLAMHASREATSGGALPLIGLQVAEHYILAPLRRLARTCARAAGEPRRATAYRGRLEQRLRRALHFPSGPAASWDNLPTRDLGDAALHIKRLAAEVKAAARPITIQLPLSRRSG